jgi:hypothetical protein
MLTPAQRLRFQTKFLALEKEESLPEPVVFSWLNPTEQPPTGCWNFKDGKHIIRVNINCSDKSVATRSARAASTFAEMIARHEFCHAKKTERDFVKINDLCKRVKAPFMLFNIFEDARIEHQKRLYSGKFNWLRWEKPADATTPLGIFFALLQREIMPSHRPALWKPSELVHGKTFPMYLADRTNNRLCRILCNEVRASGAFSNPVQTFSLVFQIFMEVCRTTSTLGLEAWLQRWMELFPQTNERGNGIKELVEGSHCSDQVAPEVVNADFVPEPSEAGKSGDGKPVSVPPAPLARDKTQLAGPKTRDDSGDEPIKSGKHIMPNFHKDERQQGDAIAGLIGRAFRCRGQDKIKTLSSSKRLNIRGLACGDISKPFIRNEVQSVGVPRVAAVFDFSGSMKGNPSSHARVLLFALNKLAKAGAIKCHAYATQSGAGCYTSQALPCREENINWEAVGGSEGMRLFFSQKMRELQEFDSIIVFTDGDIGDAGADFSSLHSRGIFPVGAYVSNISPQGLLYQQQQLSRYFDKGIARPDMVSLASDIARLISNSR